MKQAVALIAVVAFVVLGVLNIMAHEPRVGIASIALGVANALLLL
jgi:hypothetical protein